MSELATALMANSDELAQRFYDAWRQSVHPHWDVGEAAIKDHLPWQLRLIGEQLREPGRAATPAQLWQQAERLRPEARVEQDIPIAEVVQEYKLAMRVIREWVAERRLQVEFEEYSYLYEALFELVAESVRRYAHYQAERVSQERAEYLAGLAHQMRTPLAALIMRAQLLGRCPERAPQLADKLERNARHLLFLVNGVMRLERFKPEELPVRPRMLYPSNLIDDLIDDRRAAAEPKGLRLEALVDRSLSMCLDPELFTDALGNLLDNAIKYTEQGFVRVEVEPEGDTVLFRVRDSGPGISPARRKTLFRPTEPGPHGGMGIGLHVVKRAVEAQQGELGVETGLGQGSTFWFRLPRRVPERHAAGVPVPPA